MAISLVLADDHPLVHDGFELLCSREGDFRLLAKCQDGEEALQSVRRSLPDILVLETSLPKMDGFAVLREIRRDRLPTRAVILTAALDDEQALEALRLGVRGVVLKSMPTKLLAQCIRKVHAGGQWLEKQSAGRAIEKMLLREAGARRLANILTPREIEIARMVAQGQSNREISEKLLVREGTVKIHLHNVYKKLGIDNRVDLTLYAQKKGLV
jgi:two-component system nitrate/nitrite response regulator NarL